MTYSWSCFDVCSRGVQALGVGELSSSYLCRLCQARVLSKHAVSLVFLHEYTDVLQKYPIATEFRGDCAHEHTVCTRLFFLVPSPYN